MVAINFQREFAPDIQSGRKTQTIRRTARCKTGDELQLYTGQRTKDCDLIGTARCAICEPITIAEDYISVGAFRLPSGDAAHIAKIDGFTSLAAMRDWFRAKYGALPFNGYRIMWNDFRGVSMAIFIPDEAAARAAFAAHKADALAKGETCFSRRRVIAIADMFGVKPMPMVWWLEKRGLMKRGSYEWFKRNGGITYDDVIQCRVDREAADRPTSGDTHG